MNFRGGNRFEFDDLKDKANLAKHGISLAAAESLWADVDLFVVPTDYPSELRQLAIGRIDGRCWTAIFTRRSDRIRVISLRRSRHEERNAYESKKAVHHRPKSP